MSSHSDNAPVADRTTGRTPSDLAHYLVTLLGKNAALIVVAGLAIYAYKELNTIKAQGQDRLQNTYDSLTSMADWQAENVKKWMEQQKGLEALQSEALAETTKEPLRVVIRTQFESYRTERLGYIQDEWVPLFMGNVLDGPIADELRTAEDQHKILVGFTTAMMREVQKKQRALLDPLDDKEASVLREIDRAKSSEDYTRLLVTMEDLRRWAFEELETQRKEDSSRGR